MDRKCSNPNCLTAVTPSWRRIDGKLFCNACAIYSRRHEGKLRPKRKAKNPKNSPTKQRQTKNKTKNPRKRLNQRILIGNSAKKQINGNSLSKQRRLLRPQESPIIQPEKHKRIQNYNNDKQTQIERQKQTQNLIVQKLQLDQPKLGLDGKKKIQKKDPKQDQEQKLNSQNLKKDNNFISSLLTFNSPNYSLQISEPSLNFEQNSSSDKENEQLKSTYSGKKLGDYFVQNSHNQLQTQIQTQIQIQPQTQSHKPTQTKINIQNNPFKSNYYQNAYHNHTDNNLLNYNDQNNLSCYSNYNTCFQDTFRLKIENENIFENFEYKLNQNIDFNLIDDPKDPNSNIMESNDQETDLESETESGSGSETELEIDSEIDKNLQDQFKEIPRKMHMTTLQAGDCVGLLLRDGDEVFAIIRKFVKEKGENGNTYCKVTWLVPKFENEYFKVDPINLSRKNFHIGVDEPLPQPIHCITRKLNFQVL
ncbi:hypothetical protein M0812_29578 [Anaeramoeba flamelloides]|uniref:GATA-type domain-containing protein n=1 Tax=Anaeramoeba flamelloides TaxID=1746091 RepID=A0AAV7Y7X5_9EUKA|nr:hypothetical protein M0812_29578 [Anaeramoeba flamelloides]